MVLTYLYDADAAQLGHVAGLALRGAVPVAQRAPRIPAPCQQLHRCNNLLGLHTLSPQSQKHTHRSTLA